MIFDVRLLFWCLTGANLGLVKLLSRDWVVVEGFPKAANLPVPPQCGHAVVGGVNGMTSREFPMRSSTE
jgi:hypothetical protein